MTLTLERCDRDLDLGRRRRRCGGGGGMLTDRSLLPLWLLAIDRASDQRDVSHRFSAQLGSSSSN